MQLRSIFSDTPVNTGHQAGLDAIKTISIFFMILIHLYEEIFLNPDANVSGFISVLEMLDGPFGAPAFMMAMGIGMMFSRHNTPKQLITRGVHLLIFAYVLNILRSTIPGLFYDLTQGGFDYSKFIYRTFNLDILHLAGMSFILTGILKKFNVNLKKIFLIAVLMQAVGTLLLSVTVNNTFLQYFLGLFIYTGYMSCFPLLLWYIYPVIGMALGQILMYVADLEHFHKMVISICLPLFIGFSCYLISTGAGLTAFYTLEDDICYKQSLLGVAYSAIILGITMPVFFFLSKNPKLQKLVGPCHYIGSHLNAIYINQWIIICWLEYLLMFLQVELSIVWLVPMALVIYPVSIWLAKYTGKFVKKYL